MSNRLRSLGLLLFLCVIAMPAVARVISYAPYTNRNAIPAFQHRESRYFALLERPADSWWFFGWQSAGGNSEVVVYDAHGLEEPRVVYKTPASINAVAMRGNTILVSMYDQVYHWDLSTDGGTTWKRLTELEGKPITYNDYLVDMGGPYTRGFINAIMIGTDATPFVTSTPEGVWAIDANGTARKLAELYYPMLVGRDKEGAHFMVQSRQATNTFYVLDIAGHVNKIEDMDPFTNIEGWLSPDGSIYVTYIRPEGRFLHVIRNFNKSFIAGPYDKTPPPVGSQPAFYTSQLEFFAVPSYDYRGAWMIQRQTGRETTLLRYTADRGKETMWRDVAGPQVEALHTGSSGTSVLVQVHRPRIQPERLFIDPALAIWRIGEPAPQAYDELFLNEQDTKGFVHLDVEKMAEGAPFVFDSGVNPPPDIIISPSPIGTPGGGDVTQEWGVVRASLKQKLVLPGVSRLRGAFNSFWLTDLVIYNPSSGTQKVKVQYAPITDVTTRITPVSTTLTLNPKELRVVNDALMTLFGLEHGGGGLEFEPEQSVFVSSRTYTRVGEGTFGFGMQAIDVNTAASPRFPVSFAGAFPGENYRTNVLLTDTSGRGTEARLEGFGNSGPIGLTNVFLATANGGLQQMNSANLALGLRPFDSGALVVRPTRGTAIATVVAIDNRTNDPTWFPPDLPAPLVRTIPVIGHLGGAHGSRFRSDLYFVNPSNQTRQMVLEAKLWNSDAAPVRVPFTLLPSEARLVPDALKTIFGMEGIARFRYNSDGDTEGVRVTSRTYNIDENGGTYGCLIPPLNNFQSAASGEALEIIGVTAGAKMRANLGLVELATVPNGQPARVRIRIIDHFGQELESINVDVPSAGGMQINDIFGSLGIVPPPAAIIRVEPSSGLIGAYATLTDNVTNDSTFVAAALAATQ